MKIRKLIAALSLSTAVYSLLGWLYVVAIMLVMQNHNPNGFPPILSFALAHFTFWPFNMRLDTFSIVCFIISWASFTVWRLTKE
jgi:hypothetical protein